MRPLCEYMISEMLPGFRALVAKKLIDEYGFSQTEVAEMFNTTQPAISQYTRELRGKKTGVFLSNQSLCEMLNKITKDIAMGRIAPEKTGLEFCKMCKLMREINLVSGYSLC